MSRIKVKDCNKVKECHSNIDFDLWEGFRSGCRKSFKTIYEDNIKTLLSYGYRLTTDRQLVEDCLQDMFIQLWDGRHKIQISKSIRSYLLISFRRRIFKQLSQEHKLNYWVLLIIYSFLIFTEKSHELSLSVQTVLSLNPAR